MGDSEQEFTARSYQVDIYEKAVLENVIVWLPTGSGKTFIAVMLVKKYCKQVQPPYNEDGKRIFFVVNTVPLVEQQCNYVARHTGLKCKGFSGDMNVDFWTADDWLQELESNQVLVLTADILVAILNHGIMPLHKVCLIIFDECHKAVGNHPMRTIMKSFERWKNDEHPRILGLTATLLNANVNIGKIDTTIRELEITFNARVITVNDENIVLKYGKLRETFTYYNPVENIGIENKLMTLIDHMVAVLKKVKLKCDTNHSKSSKEFLPMTKSMKLKNMVEDIREHIKTMGLYGGSKALLCHMIQLEYMKKHCDELQRVVLVEFLLTQMTKMQKLITDAMDGHEEIEQLYKFSSDQILKTFEVLKNFNDTKTVDQRFCCIVFVKRRTTAQVLYQILKILHRLDDRFTFLLSDYIIGCDNDVRNHLRENMCLSKWNKEALLRFRCGQTNCIVATDILDEGVDVPSCALIVRYDPPNDYRSYIQSKGRARDTVGRYVILLSKDDDNFVPRCDTFKKVEARMKQDLIGHTDDREEVSEMEIDEKLYRTEIEPYVVVNPEGLQSAVTELSAISLVNRYCTNLVKSKFINLSPTWTLHTSRDKTLVKCYKVSITLPSASSLNETVHGNFMATIYQAKRSAAMEMCIKLHQIGELSDYLLPIDDSTVMARVDHLFPHWRSETKDPTSMPGTNAKKRAHKIAYPQAFHGSYPIGGRTLYLHVIDAKPAYPKPYQNRQLIFYDLLNDGAGFALLTLKPLPQIPDFPIFMNVGELNVSLKVNNSTLILSDETIEEIKLFHWTIFSEVVSVIKSFLMFDIDNLDNSFLVAPTDKSGKIDWDVLRKYATIEETPATEELNYLDYELALVRPNYRSPPSVYVVTQVCEDLMAKSAFPNGAFHSYMHYYKERHGVTIRNPKQPMLEVKAISNKINCIRPRGIKAGLSKRKYADILEDFDEHFVGELCNKTIFPALYWLKATYLPSVLHRISQLLVAEDLRVEIAMERRLGVLKLERDCTWPPVVVKQDIVDNPVALLEISVEDSFVETHQSDQEICGPEINTLESNLYPWKKETEPIDMFRQMDQIQLIDIEYYHQFMSSASANCEDILKKQNQGHQFVTRKPVKAPLLNILSKKDAKGPSPASIMQALTAKCAHDVFDLERLETLGDSFLKFAVSLYLYDSYPSFSEGRLTVIKGRIIGNRNLFYCGENKGLPGRMKIDIFEAMSNFIPPAFTVARLIQPLLLDNKISPNVLYEMNISRGEQFQGALCGRTISEIEGKVSSWTDTNLQTGMEHFLGVQIVPDKSVSDCVEALIGVYLSSMGLLGAFEILIWLGILPADLKLKDILHEIRATPSVGFGNPGDLMPQADYIEKQIGYKFNDRAYLLQAFTHPSYTPNRITPSYERLEFLGDAILDFLITVHIYETCDYLSPGALTDLRSALVNNITIACLSVKYGFHTALLAYAPQLLQIIERFVKFQQDRNFVVDDELLWILLEEEDCNMAEYVDVPKILGDLFESIIGAIYLDSGKNLVVVWDIIYGLMHEEIIAFSKKVPKQPIRVIYETPGAHPRFSKSTVLPDSGVVMVTLEVIIAGTAKIFHGFGSSNKQAKCAAAKQALKSIRSKA